MPRALSLLSGVALAVGLAACSKKPDDQAPPLPPPPASASASPLASASGSASPPSPPPDLKSFPNTAAGAKALVSELAKPGVDAAALSLQLRPTTADYKSIFDAATAAKIDRVYSPEWDKGTFVVSARPGQTEVQMASATVADIKAKNEKSKALPAPYAIVAAHLVGTATIYAFRFVEPGKTDGNTFDGLVYLNGHWVLIPRPWRGLDTH
jgi:hypothetical protein